MSSLVGEKRLYTRFPSEVPVDLVLEQDGNVSTFRLRTINLSVKSVEIACDDEVILAIRHQRTFPCFCRLSIALPDQPAGFDVKAQVVTYQRTSQTSYRLVLIFMELSNQHLRVLEQYLLTLRFADKTSGS